jgi:hypothetical protein
MLVFSLSKQKDVPVPDGAGSVDHLVPYRRAMQLADLRTLSNSRPTALTITRIHEVHNLRGLDRPTAVLWRAANVTSTPS